MKGIIYDSNKEPIMLILSNREKKLIGNMRAIDKKFLSYPKEMGEEEADKFMK